MYGGQELWRLHNKAVSDWGFRRDMRAYCNSLPEYENPPGPQPPSYPRDACLSQSATYYWAVSHAGWNTYGMARGTFLA